MHRSNRLMDIMDCRLEAMGPDGQFGAWPKRAWSGATVDDVEGAGPSLSRWRFSTAIQAEGQAGGHASQTFPERRLVGGLGG